MASLQPGPAPGGYPAAAAPPPPPPGIEEITDGFNGSTSMMHEDVQHFPTGGLGNKSPDGSSANVWRWTNVACPQDGPTGPPCQRSLHVASVLKDKIFVFGGYDGQNRVNDFYEFDFKKMEWRTIPPVGQLPTPRDRHTSVVYGNAFYVFAGFDGTTRVQDFYEYSFDSAQWQCVSSPSAGTAPSPRHSHAAVIYACSMFVFGGYDGSYRSDFHAYNFLTSSWSQVATAGRVPRARYRATCVVHGQSMYLFGGHDGTRHLNDVHVFDFEERVWQQVVTEGPLPIPRDSHVSVVHGQSMYIFGGSTGSAMNDFHELRLDTRKWSPVQAMGAKAPGHRFCHVACVHGDSMYVFGGYDGSNRLNDFVEFHFGLNLLACDIPPSSLVQDLRSLVNNEEMSDIVFMVEDQPVYAHKILCMRCTYFRAMLTGGMSETRASEIVLQDVRHPIFLALLEYLYTDQCEIPLDIAMELFQAADQFGVERLKKICESKMLASINVENAATIFHAADVHNAKSLREKCLNFVLANFDPVTKSASFEEMGRTNVELVFEILQKR
mmetsp:Transcript_13575/g.31683  ORF Transcript_13575/g.31683 Transcript_13575/m.31683 type:complete len:551 (-) Transcript_13575:450-2102(-)